MSDRQTTGATCCTCCGRGFVFRGGTMQHESDRAPCQRFTSRLYDFCPECLGTGVTIPRALQRTPWELAFEFVGSK